MRPLNNENGIALVTALMFTMIILGIIMTLMYYLTLGIQMGGSQKRYRNSLESSYGGVEVATKEIIPKLFTDYSTGRASLLRDFGPKINLQIPNANFKTKLTTDTDNWPATLSKTGNPKEVPDLTFQLKGSDSTDAGYTVYTKVIDTVTGNSDTSGMDFLDAGIGVAGAGSGISPKHTATLYTIEVQGERTSNPKEKARLSVLYAY